MALPSHAIPTGSARASPGKFADPLITADGRPRAAVHLAGLRTLWFNTGTLCNLACANCYIESSPRNDRLVYLTPADIRPYFDEMARDGWPTEEIGFTGGEPFMNPDIIALLDEALDRGFRALVLTNAMHPMMKRADALQRLRGRHGRRLAIRVSLDHYTEALHALERGARSWGPAIEGLIWLARHGFEPAVAGRTRWGEDEASLRRGYAALFERLDIALDAEDRKRLTLFPEMDADAEVPEITEACWSVLGVRPSAMMCASSRMVVKRKGDDHPVVLSCTLLPYDGAFEMGASLADSTAEVRLNHPHCARFCVLGGGTCSDAEGAASLA